MREDFRCFVAKSVVLCDLCVFGVKSLSWKWCWCQNSDKYEVCSNPNFFRMSKSNNSYDKKNDVSMTGSGVRSDMCVKVPVLEKYGIEKIFALVLF